jgi:hypothetical protein
MIGESNFSCEIAYMHTRVRCRALLYLSTPEASNWICGQDEGNGNDTGLVNC